MNAEDVAHYLQKNPAFFEEYADALAEIYLPHPHGGRAVPISERQILTLREKNRQLEHKLTELIQFAEENDKISEKVHRVSLTLLAANDLEALLNGFYFNLLEDFAVPHIALRLWGQTTSSSNLSEFNEVSLTLRSLVETFTTPRCGPHASEEIAGWFGEAGDKVKSFAQIPLRTEKTSGLLVLASEDSQRFYPEMGTLYLVRMSDLLGSALARLL